MGVYWERNMTVDIDKSQYEFAISFPQRNSVLSFHLLQFHDLQTWEPTKPPQNQERAMEFEYTLIDNNPLHPFGSFGTPSHPLTVLEPTVGLPTQLHELFALAAEPNSFEEMQRHFFWTQALLAAAGPQQLAATQCQLPQRLEVVEEDDTSSSSSVPNTPASVELNEEEESVMSSYLNLATAEHWTPFIKTEPQADMNCSEAPGEGEYKEEIKEAENKFPSIWSIKNQQPQHSFSYSSAVSIPPLPSSPPPMTPTSSPRATPIPTFTKMQR